MHNEDVPTVIEGDYEWDEQKAALNLIRHEVSFPEAILQVTGINGLKAASGNAADRQGWQHGARHAHAQREVTLGLTPKGVLVVVSTERGDRTRIISARKASNHEERGYQANRK